MEMGMEIDAVPEGLDDGDNARLKARPRHSLKIDEKRSFGTSETKYQETRQERDKARIQGRRKKMARSAPQKRQNRKRLLTHDQKRNRWNGE
jgi:hypothetical protein